MASAKSRFKKIIVDGYEIDIDKYTELQWKAYEMGMEVDPETLNIVPMGENIKQWPDGDRQPEDYGGR